MKDPLLPADEMLVSAKSQIATALLETWYGMKTAEHLTAAALGYEDDDRYWYEPSGWLTLWRALPPHEVSENDVFVDLGSGKGRVVAQAARHFDFKRIIGVEVSPLLHDMARLNLERARGIQSPERIELVNTDVLAWEPPEDLSVVYMHNPFGGETFSKAIDRLLTHVDCREGPLKLIYLNPVEHERVMATGRAAELPLPRRARRAGRIRSYELR